MSGISLTASMRSNLLSLQNIAGQQDIVQHRLATGLKVSSAIDNPSSYYTASSLNNRAADLTALLDSMSQGIQTIKAASEGLQIVSTFLEQAASVAATAISNIDYPAADYFRQLVGDGGAVVETAQELLDAVNSGKETIVVYGEINIDDDDGDISLRDNQKLVGVGYFGNFDSDINKFSRLIITKSGVAKSGVSVLGNNALVSDLTVDFTSTYNTDIKFEGAGIYVKGKNNLVKNVDVKLAIARNSGNGPSGIKAVSSSTLNVEGNIFIEGHGNNPWGIFSQTASSININAKVNTNSQIISHNAAEVNISAASQISALSVSAFVTGKVNIEKGTELFFEKENQAAAFRVNNDFIVDDKRYNFDNVSADTINFAALNFSNLEDFFGGVFSGKAFIKSDYQSDVGGKYAASYLNILEQMDKVALDSAYKGINLLQGQNLKINFNEDRSSATTVNGVEISVAALKLQTTEWQTAQSIANSLAEIAAALNQIRSYSAQFGNYYSIVSTRQNFTENLINVLEEGADKLTLADMNQESANMLALQTAQQLAVNSLSLASQAAQSILKLF